MENNNNFENGFYGSAPQKPFTDKSSDAPANPQTFSASEGESVNQSEPTAAEIPIEQPVQNNPEVNNASQEAYQHHIKTQHFQTYKQGTLHMVKSLDLVDMRQMAPECLPLIFNKARE